MTSPSTRSLARAWLPKAVFSRLAAPLKQLSVLRLLAKEYGQYGSMKHEMSVGKDGQPVPWYSYPATEFLSCLDLSAASVFEYGSGNSSRWWLARCSKLVAVENDRSWFDQIRASISSPEFQYIFAEEADYARQIDAFGAAFEVIIVDGVRRADCALAAIDHLKIFGGKLLILDNSDWYPSLVPHIRKSLGWVQADFHGFGPISRFTTTTSIFINPAHSQYLYGSKSLQSAAGMKLVASDDLQPIPTDNQNTG
jgi:hypothetical protein